MLINFYQKAIIYYSVKKFETSLVCTSKQNHFTTHKISV